MTYVEVIDKHSAKSEKYPVALDGRVLVRTIAALTIIDYPEHKDSVRARRYLEWAQKSSFDVIPRACSAIEELIENRLAAFRPKSNLGRMQG